MSFLTDHFKNLRFNREGAAALLTVGLVMTVWVSAIGYLFGPALTRPKKIPVPTHPTPPPPLARPDTIPTAPATAVDSSILYRDAYQAARQDADEKYKRYHQYMLRQRRPQKTK